MDVTVSAQEHMFIFFHTDLFTIKVKNAENGCVFFFLVIPFMNWKMTIRNQICLAAY